MPTMTRNPIRGRVQGASIALDAPIPELEGKRVILLVEPEESGCVRDEQLAWNDWVGRGSDGPSEA
jgi:hypothetical protein